MHNYDDDDDEGGKGGDTKGKLFFEFDCPSCDANNPWPDGFKEKDEINCHYCGATLLVRMSDSGKPKFKEI